MHVSVLQSVRKIFGGRVISHAITNRDATCRTHVPLAYCRCSWEKKEVKENPSCTITLTSLARPISFSRWACNSFRQFFCRRTRENSGSRNYRDSAGPTRSSNRAEINADPSNLSSAMTKGRRRRATDRGSRGKKRAKLVGCVWKGEKDSFFARCSQFRLISFSHRSTSIPFFAHLLPSNQQSSPHLTLHETCTRIFKRELARNSI